MPFWHEHLGLIPVRGEMGRVAGVPGNLVSHGQSDSRAIPFHTKY